MKRVLLKYLLRECPAMFYRYITCKFENASLNNLISTQMSELRCRVAITLNIREV